MSFSQRLRRNRDGKIFMPMNVEGGGYEQSFFTTRKLVTLIIMGIVTIWVVSFLGSSQASISGYVITIAIMILVYQWLIRFVIFEEKYYYKVYQKTKLYKNPTPAIFWDIVSFRDREDGTLAIFSDMKVGVFLKLERDTIIGKGEEFRETHYEALSEFYKELNNKNICIVHLDIMEQAGKDNRLEHLDRMISSVDNENIAKLLQLQLGSVKNSTRETLYETDYILCYTDKMAAADYLINDVLECAYKLLDGAYTGFEILTSKEIKELPKDIYCVSYFDYTEAIQNLFKQYGMSIPKAFDIVEIKHNDGSSTEVKEKEKIILQNLSSCIKNGTLKSGEWSIKEAFNGKLDKILNRDLGLSEQYNAKFRENIQINEDVNDEEIIIDLDNEAFGGEYGIGMNNVKSDNLEANRAR